MAAPNMKYVQSNRGIIKIVEIVIGFILCSLLCYNWYGGRSCFGEGRIGYASGLNFVILVINLVVFILNVLDLAVWRLERFYTWIATILFVIACALMIWYIIEVNTHREYIIISTVLIGIMAALFSYEGKILHGEASNF